MARMVPTSWQVDAEITDQPLPPLSLPASWHGRRGQAAEKTNLDPSSQDSECPLWPLQETGLKVNQPASFAVQLNGARGVIDARVHTPSGAVEECYVSELDSGELALPL